MSLVVVLFIIFNVLFSSSIIKKGDVGSYRDGDIVLTYRFNYYPYKVLPKDTVVIFGNSAGNWDPLIGMIISVPGETFLDRTLLTDTYLIALSNQEVVIERNQILSIVVGKLYRDD
ncbi:MAG: hypothetical protein NT162_02555 [Candidatus Woesebacteria bacterium]|nr:hypothetical protein [Candidatus Woesebacteria bacterium]